MSYDANDIDTSNGQRPTLIDHLYTNKPERIIEIAVPSLALCDYNPICFTRKIHISDTKKAHTEIRYHDIQNVDKNIF